MLKLKLKSVCEENRQFNDEWIITVFYR